MPELFDAARVREAHHPIEPLFLRRWSPRAMSGESLSEGDLMSLFEAARWAPSSYNEQEWRFLYARRETPHFTTFTDLLVEANQAWCAAAGVLGVVLSHQVFERNGKPNRVHTFDAGLAYENLALQGAAVGLVVHAMAGFEVDRARQALLIPDDYSIEVMFAVGHPGNTEDLPEPMRGGEVPSGRKPVTEITCEGPFAF